MENEIDANILAEAKDRYDVYLDEKNWDAINNLFLEMQDKGFPEFEVNMIEKMTEDELNEHRAWIIRNGDVNDQIN